MTTRDAGRWDAPLRLAPVGPRRGIRVAGSPSGHAVAAWWARSGAGRRARASVRAPGGPWSAPVDLSRVVPRRRSDTSPAPHVSANGGEALVVWGAGARGGIVQGARLDAAGRVEGPTTLAPGGGSRGLQVGLDALGRATAAWTRAGGRLAWSTQRAAGAWPRPRRVSSGPACGYETRRAYRPVVRGGRAGVNRLAIAPRAFVAPLGPGAYRLRVRALTSTRESCARRASFAVRR